MVVSVHHSTSNTASQEMTPIAPTRDDARDGGSDGGMNCVTSTLQTETCGSDIGVSSLVVSVDQSTSNTASQQASPIARTSDDVCDGGSNGGIHGLTWTDQSTSNTAPQQASPIAGTSDDVRDGGSDGGIHGVTSTDQSTSNTAPQQASPIAGTSNDARDSGSDGGIHGVTTSSMPQGMPMQTVEDSVKMMLNTSAHSARNSGKCTMLQKLLQRPMNMAMMMGILLKEVMEPLLL
jgi:hypothetical protein